METCVRLLCEQRVMILSSVGSEYSPLPSGEGSFVRIAVIVSAAVSPANAGCPERISNSTAPNAKISER